MKTWKFDWPKQAEPISEDDIVPPALQVYEALKANLFEVAAERSVAAAIQAAISATLHFARYNLNDSGLEVPRGDRALKLARDARL